MSTSFFTKSLLSLSIAASLLTATAVQAADAAKAHQHQHKHDVVSRQTDKVKTDNGFTRTTTRTDAAGETATRKADVVVDKAAGTRTREVTGTNFNGGTYSGESVAHKTDTGYTAEGHFTNAEGKTTERSVNAVVDKNAGTVTKTISTTPNGGETTTKTVVKPLPEKNGNK